MFNNISSILSNIIPQNTTSVLDNIPTVEALNLAIFAGGVFLTQKATSYFCKNLVPQSKDFYFNLNKLLSYSTATFLVANVMKYFECISEIPAPLAKIGNAGALIFCTFAINKILLNCFSTNPEDQVRKVFSSNTFMHKHVNFPFQGVTYPLVVEHNPDEPEDAFEVGNSDDYIRANKIVYSKTELPLELRERMYEIFPSKIINFMAVPGPFNRLDFFDFVFHRIRKIKDAIFIQMDKGVTK